jgi:hypothetical protein
VFYLNNCDKSEREREKEEKEEQEMRLALLTPCQPHFFDPGLLNFQSISSQCILGGIPLE